MEVDGNQALCPSVLRSWGCFPLNGLLAVILIQFPDTSKCLLCLTVKDTRV